jgi:UDP-glucuronate decarboxylase
VDDLVKGLVSLMESEGHIKGPINLGNPEEFTIDQLARLVIELTGSSSKLTFKDLPSDDPKQRKPDIAKAKESLNWQPSTGVKEGLTATIGYFDQLLSSSIAKLDVTA